MRGDYKGQVRMTSVIVGPLSSALMVTTFVTTMMMVVEYLSVATEGAFQRALKRSRWSQYVAAVALGALPGCLLRSLRSRYSSRSLPRRAHLAESRRDFLVVKGLNLLIGLMVGSLLMLLTP